jgi:hypothetical protein
MPSDIDPCDAMHDYDNPSTQQSMFFVKPASQADLFVIRRRCTQACGQHFSGCRPVFRERAIEAVPDVSFVGSQCGCNLGPDACALVIRPNTHPARSKLEGCLGNSDLLRGLHIRPRFLDCIHYCRRAMPSTPVYRTNSRVTAAVTATLATTRSETEKLCLQVWRIKVSWRVRSTRPWGRQLAKSRRMVAIARCTGPIIWLRCYQCLPPSNRRS